jgi:hypothetical protein
MVLMVLFSGFILPKSSMNDGWIWFYWINPAAWAIRSVTVNEFTASRYDFDLCTNKGCSIKRRYGDVVLDSRGNPTQAHWAWYGVAVLVAEYVALMFVSSVILTYWRVEPKPLPPIRFRDEDYIDPEDDPLNHSQKIHAIVRKSIISQSQAQEKARTQGNNTTTIGAAAGIGISNRVAGAPSTEQSISSSSQERDHTAIDGNGGPEVLKGTSSTSGTSTGWNSKAVVVDVSYGKAQTPTTQSNNGVPQSSADESGLLSTSSTLLVSVPAPLPLSSSSGLFQEGAGAGEGEGEGVVFMPFEPVSLAFKDIWYTVHAGGKKTGEEIDLLKNVSGFFEPGTMSALMGNTGAGRICCDL